MQVQVSASISVVEIITPNYVYAYICTKLKLMLYVIRYAHHDILYYRTGILSHLTTTLHTVYVWYTGYRRGLVQICLAFPGDRTLEARS